MEIALGLAGDRNCRVIFGIWRTRLIRLPD
jgi:hypothetical protein